MGVIKNRMKQVFMGNVQFQNMATVKGNSSSAQFFGVTAIGSNAYATVSTSVVKSNDAIFLQPIYTGAFVQQNSGLVLVVSSIQEGGSFRIHSANMAVGLTAALSVAWEIKRVGS